MCYRTNATSSRLSSDAALLAALPDAPLIIAPGGFHACGQLTKQARFAVPFEMNERPRYFGNDWVACFGLELREQSQERWQAQRRQLLIHYPRCDDEQAENFDDNELSCAVNDFIALNDDRVESTLPFIDGNVTFPPSAMGGPEGGEPERPRP